MSTLASRIMVFDKGDGSVRLLYTPDQVRAYLKKRTKDQIWNGLDLYNIEGDWMGTKAELIEKIIARHYKEQVTPGLRSDDPTT